MVHVVQLLSSLASGEAAATAQRVHQSRRRRHRDLPGGAFRGSLAGGPPEFFAVVDFAVVDFAARRAAFGDAIAGWDPEEAFYNMMGLRNSKASMITSPCRDSLCNGQEVHLLTQCLQSV